MTWMTWHNQHNDTMYFLNLLISLILSLCSFLLQSCRHAPWQNKDEEAGCVKNNIVAKVSIKFNLITEEWAACWINLVLCHLVGYEMQPFVRLRSLFWPIRHGRGSCWLLSVTAVACRCLQSKACWEERGCTPCCLNRAEPQHHRGLPLPLVTQINPKTKRVKVGDWTSPKQRDTQRCSQPSLFPVPHTELTWNLRNFRAWIRA